MTPLRLLPVDDLDALEGQRAAHRASLTALPELFVEASIGRSDLYAIEGEERLGYLATLDDILTAFFVLPVAQPEAGSVLTAAASELGLRRAWACSFDPVALAACEAAGHDPVEIGHSFRTYRAAHLTSLQPRPQERIAAPDDLGRVQAANHPDVFDDPSDIPRWIEQGWISLFELAGEVVGFGLCTPTAPDTRACDIGIRVCEAHQRQGLGAWIVQRMAARAASLGLVPVAGCDSANAASRRTLERAGFVADHRLLQFKL